MARKFRVSARISAEDRASGTVQRVEGRFKRFANFLANRFVITAGEAARAIGAIFRQIEQSATLRSQTEALRRNLAAQEIAFDSFIAKLEQVADGQVRTADLIQSSNQAILLGIPARELSQLLDIARASAIQTGESVTKAFDDIVTGIGRASPLILDNLGIVLKLGPAYDAMAASLGKTTAELTAQEQKQAILNATLEAGLPRVREMAGAQDEVSRSIAQGRKELEDFGDQLGDLAAQEIPPFIEGIRGIGSALEEEARDGNALAKLLNFLKFHLEQVGIAIGFGVAKFSELGRARLALKRATAEADAAEEALSQRFEDQIRAALGVAKATNKAADATERLADASEKTESATAKLGRALDVVTSAELSEEVLRIEKALAGAREELGANSDEYVRLEQIARERVESLKDRILDLRDGIGELREETRLSVDEIESFGRANRDAAQEVDVLTGALARNAQEQERVRVQTQAQRRRERLSGSSIGGPLISGSSPLFPGLSVSTPGGGVFTITRRARARSDGGLEF